MLKLEGKRVFHDKIQSLVTDDVCFNIQECKENVKKCTLVKSLFLRRKSETFERNASILKIQ